jgi:hypothetical protein
MSSRCQKLNLLANPCIEIDRLIVTLPVGLVQKFSPLKGGWRFHIAKCSSENVRRSVARIFSFLIVPEQSNFPVQSLIKTSLPRDRCGNFGEQKGSLRQFCAFAHITQRRLFQKRPIETFVLVKSVRVAAIEIFWDSNYNRLLSIHTPTADCKSFPKLSTWNGTQNINSHSTLNGGPHLVWNLDLADMK